MVRLHNATFHPLISTEPAGEAFVFATVANTAVHPAAARPKMLFSNGALPARLVAVPRCRGLVGSARGDARGQSALHHFPLLLTRPAKKGWFGWGNDGYFVDVWIVPKHRG